MRRPLTPRTLAAAAGIACSQALLLAGFAVAGRSDGMAAAAACALGWLAVLILGGPGASAFLTVSLALGVLAALAGAPGWLVAAGAGASLAAWDLTLLAGSAAAGGASGTRLLTVRLRALAAGILPGLGMAVLLGPVHVAIPFAGLLAVAAAMLLALDRAARRWR